MLRGSSHSVGDEVHVLQHTRGTGPNSSFFCTSFFHSWHQPCASSNAPLFSEHALHYYCLHASFRTCGFLCLEVFSGFLYSWTFSTPTGMTGSSCSSVTPSLTPVVGVIQYPPVSHAFEDLCGINCYQCCLWCFAVSPSLPLTESCKIRRLVLRHTFALYLFSQPPRSNTTLHMQQALNKHLLA